MQFASKKLYLQLYGVGTKTKPEMLEQLAEGDCPAPIACLLKREIKANLHISPGSLSSDGGLMLEL